MKTRRQPAQRPVVVRRVARKVGILTLASPLVLGSAVLLAGPAAADVPVGWSNPADVNPVHAVLLLGAIPLGLFLLIALAVYGPSLARGERITPSSVPMRDQWLGGPRTGTAELAGPDDEQSSAGGARGRW